MLCVKEMFIVLPWKIIQICFSRFCILLFRCARTLAGSQRRKDPSSACHLLCRRAASLRSFSTSLIWTGKLTLRIPCKYYNKAPPFHVHQFARLSHFTLGGCSCIVESIHVHCHKFPFDVGHTLSILKVDLIKYLSCIQIYTHWRFC